MKRMGSLAVLLAVVFVPCHAAQQGGVGKFMRPKLEHAQKVLEGLALEDYEMIARSAKAMFRLSEAAEWQVLPDPEYVSYSAEFQKLTNQLAVSAGKQNLDAATLNYVQLTLNCVKCHQHVRDVRRVASAK